MRRRAALVAGVLAPLVLLAAKAHAEPLFAEVVLNGVSTGVVVEFDALGDQLSASSADLRELGLRVPDGRTSLSALRGLRYTVDAAGQTVAISAEPDAFSLTELGASDTAHRRPDRPGWGAILDYGLSGGVDDRGGADMAGMLGARLFGPGGVFTTAFAGRASGDGGKGDGLRRLESSLTLASPDAPRRLVIGDFVNAGFSWTRPLRAAGISMATDFAMRPDLIAAPTLELAGSAAAPSTVDLYVNEVRKLSTSVPAGPFSIARPPVVDGRGQVKLVVTDPLGRETVRTLPFYAASDLLRPGLTAYALEAGVVRSGHGGDQDGYRDPFAAVAVRRGLNEAVTLEAHSAANERLRKAGAGFTAKVAEAGLVGAALDVSQGVGRDGARLHLSARRQTERYSVFAAASEAFGDFTDLAGDAGDPVLRRTLSAGLSLQAETLGAFSLSYNRQVGADGGVEVLAANWSRPVAQRATLYANLFAVGESRSGPAFTFGLSMPLSDRRFGNVEASTAHQRFQAAARVSESPPSEGGWGWRAAAEAGDDARVEGELRRESDVGEIGGGVALTGEGAAARLYGSGSAVWIGGAPRLAARVGESFALIETGMPDLEILLENRSVGRTDRHGRFLLPALPAFATSRIAVRPESAPLSASVERETAEVRPPKGAGVVVKLPVVPVRTVLARLVRMDGTDVPLGSAVTLDGEDVGSVGYDGTVFVLNRGRGRGVLEAAYPDGRCRVEVGTVDDSEELPEIGSLVCRPA